MDGRLVMGLALVGCATQEAPSENAPAMSQEEGLERLSRLEVLAVGDVLDTDRLGAFVEAAEQAAAAAGPAELDPAKSCMDLLSEEGQILMDLQELEIVEVTELVLEEWPAESGCYVFAPCTPETERISEANCNQLQKAQDIADATRGL